MTRPADTRTRILADAARRLDRAQRQHPHAFAYAAAAARQHALPFYTAADERREERRERHTFEEATRTFRTMTDWSQTRGQSREARIRAGLRRVLHFQRCAGWAAQSAEHVQREEVHAVIFAAA